MADFKDDRASPALRRIVAALAVVLVVIVGAGEVEVFFAQGQARIIVDPSRTFQPIQTITGWEATAFADQDSLTFPAYRDRLFDLLVNDLGITRLRLPIRSGAENAQDFWTAQRDGAIPYELWRCARYSTVNDNSDPYAINAAGFQFSEIDNITEKVVLPIRRRVEARGEKFFLNVNYVAFTTQITASGCPAGLQYIHTNAEEYAEFVLATYRHLQMKYGLIPDAWEVILEPDNTSQWRGPQLAAAIVAAGNRLSANRYTPRFIAPSNSSMSNAVSYFDQMIANPAVRPLLLEFSYHRYGGVTAEALQAIGSRRTQYGIQTAMLECINAGYQDLHADLTIGGNSSWAQYTIAGTIDYGGQYYVVDPSGAQVRMASRTPYLRQYFRFVRPGAVRVSASSSDQATYDPVAFRNKDGALVVVVKAASSGPIQVDGLAPGLYGIKYTTRARQDVDLPDTSIQPGQSLAASIPADGVITIYGKTSGKSPIINAIVDGASYTGPVAPGQVVTAFGSGLGPETLASGTVRPDGFLDTTAGNCRISFDGIAAPVLYAQASQTSAIVPFGMYGRDTASVVVTCNGSESQAFPLALRPVRPAIFTLDRSGRGPAALLNENGTVNSASQPAAKGSIVVFYATGAGQTTPPGIDGLVISPSSLPAPLLRVTVRIGGLDAAVLYAGAAPGMVSGVLQVNTRVPPTVTSGFNVPLTLLVGDAASPDGPTLAVQ